VPKPRIDDESLISRIDRLDVSLFDHIEAQLEFEDMRSLLALHAGACRLWPRFCWLEIGSYLGGSLQVLVRDPRCFKILSIDPRPLRQPDERGQLPTYGANSTQHMLELLADVPGASLDKLKPITASTTDLTPEHLPSVPEICFIDGEHTDEAALHDARFCYSAMRGSGCIVFHDAAIVYRAIAHFIDELTQEHVEFRPYLLPNTIFVIELGSVQLLDVPQVTQAVLNNYKGYLFSLAYNDYYRSFYNRQVFRWIREARALGRSAHQRLGELTRR
jgi:hypothetical protein